MRSIRLIACLTMLCTGVAFAASPVAYVYEGATYSPDQPSHQISSLIWGYAAAPDGKLTPIDGSPFVHTAGHMVGTNGTNFITQDGSVLYSYSVSSTGAIGALVSQINTLLYGNAGSAELDRAGSYVYMPSDYGAGPAIQTFQVSKAGVLTLKGEIYIGDSNQVMLSPPSITGNSEFGIALSYRPGFSFPIAQVNTLVRESTGMLNLAPNTTVINPAPNLQWTGSQSPDPTNHLAVLLDSGVGGGLLASYTLSSQGLVSTNTLENMPSPGAALGGFISLNPAGTILAAPCFGCTPGDFTGINFFHFNGAKPITQLPYHIVSTHGFFDGVAWDKADHLYALNVVSGGLHVYTVTPTSVVEAPGSPYDIPNVENPVFCGSYCFDPLIVRTF
jgi:hypothetical protein